MSLEDKSLAMMVRKMVVKTPLDITMLEITCRKGTVELAGTVRKPNDHVGATLDLRKELAKLVNYARATRGVRDVYADRVRIIE